VKIQLITPASLGVKNGNSITAIRWAGMLRKLGHRVALNHLYRGTSCDLMIALHARRSFDAIQRFRDKYPDRPLIVVLTGTDLYRDIHRNRRAQRSLELATRLVALQRMAYKELPKRFHAKTRIIYQSAVPYIEKPPSVKRGVFEVSVIGHLRAEKDPLRAAMAVRRLPASSRIRVLHIGRALDEELKKRALAETARNHRYRWIGELPHAKTRRMLARSHLLVITSLMEGSANVLSEALASLVPVIASKISGLIGTLGDSYPGYFQVGRTDQLTQMLQRAESDSRFYKALKQRCTSLRKMVAPERELRAWQTLLRELAPGGH
jgi:putative glycosyltransferase (TIGR04348 family)